MRTVTFSDADVAKAVNALCVSTWKNRVDGFLNTEKTAEERIKTSTYEAFATKNFCTFFVTPDRKVLHYVSGYFAPQYFLRQVEFARKLAEQALDADRRPTESAVAAFRNGHVQARRELAAQVAELRKEQESGRPFKSEDQKANKHSASRRHSLIEGLRHLMEVHLDLADRTVEHDTLVPLDDVFTKHLYGNRFTEE